MDINKEVSQKMQKIWGDMVRCSAKCSDNSTASREDMERCRQTCKMPWRRANKLIQQEVFPFMGGLMVGFTDCNDSVKDNWSGKESQADQLQMQEEFLVCAKKCANENIDKLPELVKRCKAALKNM